MVKNPTNINIKSCIQLYLIFSVFLIINGCAQNDAYRINFAPCSFNQPGDCSQNALQYYAPSQAAEYRLGFVEFDDQGQLRQREQMEAVLDNYFTVAAKDDVLLILFIHGWHHSARPGDDNIHEFRKLLEKIARIENTNANLNNHAPRKILGLYVGWRGESIEIPLLNKITFWERKNTAHEIGLEGVTELLLKMEEITNVKMGIASTEEPKTRNNRLIVIGHSFGGTVLYTALQQIMADRFIDSRPNKTYSDDAKGFGDLVILMNPAFEAIRFATLYDISQQDCRNYFPSQLPRMAILTSEKDYATRFAFPLGRSFSTIFETHTTSKRHHCTANGPKEIFIEQGEADRNAIGHFKPYHTHELVPATTKQLRGDDAKYSHLKNIWSKQINEGTLHFEDVDLIHLGNTKPLNPYLNIYVDGKLIPDHNKIWGDSISDFIRDLIVLSSLPVQNGKH